MNRTGLFIALALWLVIGVVFGLYPELDLKLAALFFDPDTKTFPLKLNGWAGFARDAAMWVAWWFVRPPLVASPPIMIHRMNVRPRTGESAQPAEVAGQQRVTDERDRVDEAVRDDQRPQPAGAHPDITEHEPHHHIAQPGAVTLVQVIRPA